MVLPAQGIGDGAREASTRASREWRAGEPRVCLLPFPTPSPQDCRFGYPGRLDDVGPPKSTQPRFRLAACGPPHRQTPGGQT